MRWMIVGMKTEWSTLRIGGHGPMMFSSNPPCGVTTMSSKVTVWFWRSIVRRASI